MEGRGGAKEPFLANYKSPKQITSVPSASECFSQDSSQTWNTITGKVEK